MEQSMSDLNHPPIQVGDAMYQLAAELFPICRSITGDGVRATLAHIQRQIPLTTHEVASGTPVFDWTVPKEWNIRDAYIRNEAGARVVDFRQSNLHVVNYSVPVNQTMSLAELKKHLFSLPDKPDWIPYRTSYYKENWGFCLRHRDLLNLTDGNYEVVIDSSLEPGHLTYGEYLIPGQSADEVLISCHTCHPSLANDNLSGVSLAVALAQRMRALSARYSYRFLFIPGTIGAITWLALNKDKAARIKHGLVLTCVGDPGQTTYKKSRRGDADIDRATLHVLKQSGSPFAAIDFYPYGYDERQYCSPGFNLAVGCLMRSQHGEFAEYHTSADNLDLIQPAFLQDSYNKVAALIDVLEGNRYYMNQNPYCEPQLGKRGLYDVVDGEVMAMLWTLNFSDGKHSLLDIAERAGMSFERIHKSAQILAAHGLLKESGAGDSIASRPAA
ncbi:MAG: DUF4910 domain-containing protein [Burkholderiales bacterium]|nr:DUF4910 domain-containing protein [Burkholderiales bacterium]